MERDLPGLVSITSSRAMAAASTSIPVSTSTVYVPEIIPPSPQSNPFIYHASNMPDGVVFIAVGSIVGAIFFAIAIWWCIATVISYRNTKAANDILTHNDYTYVVEKQPLAKANNNNNINSNNRIISDSSSMGNFASNEYELEEKYLYPNTNNNSNSIYHDDDNDLQFGVEQFNAIQPENTYNNYRNSLFISPTLQMQSGNNNNNNNNPYMTPRRNSTVMLDKPTLAASPERKKKKNKSKHKRNQSSLGLLSASPSKSAIDLSTTRGHRKSASVYLDNMLTDSIDHHV